MKGLLFLLGGVLLPFLLCGCQSNGPDHAISTESVDFSGYSLVFEVDESRKDAQGDFRMGEVHVMVLPHANAEVFQDEPVEAFFAGKSDVVVGATLASIQLGPDDFKLRLDEADPSWSMWTSQTGAWEDQFLFLILEDGGQPANNGTEPDPRRLVLPLHPAAWNNVSAIRFRVTDQGIVCLTPFSI